MRRALALSLCLLWSTGQARGEAPDLWPFAAMDWDIFVDLRGTGKPDRYWLPFHDAASQTCSLSLYRWPQGSFEWIATIPDCVLMPFAPIFHTRSFMGDAARDFSLVVKQPPGFPGDLGYYLYAGDGATGQLRSFSFVMGNAQRPEIFRDKGVNVVDFQIPGYPGPALFVRNTGGNGDQRGHLFYFPPGSASYRDLTQVPSVINPAFFQGYPFPGPDIAALDGDGNTLYTSIYNTFNWDLDPCEVPSASGYDFLGCGVPDGNTPESPYWNRGMGYFMGKAPVGDVDADGVDDVLTEYLWNETVYPGRPKGNVAWLGAPQYDMWYNPQNDGNACSAGRHYGLTALVSFDDSPYLKNVDLAGTPVDAFSDVYQAVSRNVAVVDTSPHPTLPTLQRTLRWNNPLNTVIPGCNMTLMYDNAMHYPGSGIMSDAAGNARLIHYNRWSQAAPATICEHEDVPCHLQVLAEQTGRWTWEVLDARTGAVVDGIPDGYVWDAFPDATPGDFWIVLSSQADRWNLGSIAIGSGSPAYRDDLQIFLYHSADHGKTHVQSLSCPAKPSMKHSFWQQFDPAIASNWTSYRLFTVPLEDSALPGFVLSTPAGLSLYAFDGNSWTERGRYDAAGHLVAETVASLTASRPAPGTLRLDWTRWDGDQTVFDVVRGDLVGLVGSGGDFAPATETCLANDATAPPVDDGDVPASGQGFWYLLRSVNCGTNATYDTGEPSQIGLRDAEIGASGSDCD